MMQTPRVFLQRSGRLCIAGIHEESEQATALLSWLYVRREVVQVAQRRPAGVFYVDFEDESEYPGHFLRALQDWLYTLTRHHAEPFGIQVVHAFPGRVRLGIKGLSSQKLATLAVRALALPGVTGSQYLRGSRTLLLRYDPHRTSATQIIDALSKLDPSAWIFSEHLQLRWGGALLATSTLILCLTRVVPFSALAMGVVLSTLRPLHRSAIALIQGQLSIDLLDVAATFAALASRRPATAAFVIWMVAVGDLLLDISANNARTALSTVMQRKEREAGRIAADGSIEWVPAQKLLIGNRFLVPTGRSISADGCVVSGAAEVDEKALTGESHLLSKRIGDRVFASSVVVEGQVIVEVHSTGKNTEAAKIERILNTIGDKPLTLQRDALELASQLVMPTFSIAASAAALASDVSRAICVLITDFGTGIRVAVPVSALTAMAIAAREGILVKGAQYLERLSPVDTIVFDKTGTLTNGVPEVVEIATLPGYKKSRLIALCASAEARHEHPVARALKCYAEQHGIALIDPKPGSEKYVIGRGLSAWVKEHKVQVGRASWMRSQRLNIEPLKRHLVRLKRNQISSLCVAVDDLVVGVVGYCDGTRPESAAIVRRLQEHGKRKALLLSGDSPEVVRSVAHEVGIADAVGALLPRQKADYIRRLREAGHIVAMVGDGINDAPALAAADVGISMTGSSDVAVETADVILLEGGLARLEKAFAISDQAMRSVRQNLGVVIVPNAIAIVLGALGIITPPLAAIINNGTTLIAVLTGTVPLLRGPKRSSSVNADLPLKVGHRLRK
jgi:Cu2+-exporting ATPase